MQNQEASNLGFLISLRRIASQALPVPDVFPSDFLLLNLFFPLFQTILSTGEECPTVFSHVWIREANKQVWAKAFLLLKDKKLYMSYKVCRFLFC